MILPSYSVVDTNWFIGVFEGRETLPTTQLHSIVTRIELLSRRGLDGSEIASVQSFLASSEEIGLTDAIAQRAAELRRTFGGKLPDAVVAATAELYEAPLLTLDRGMVRYASVVSLPALD